MFILSAPAFRSPLDDGPEACWQKGVQAAQIAKGYVPGRIYMKFEKLDSDGKTISQKETWLELRPGENQGKVLKVIEDGKDISREELEKETIKKEGGKGKKSAGGQSINLSSEELVPLLTNSKKPVAYQHLGMEMDHGVECHVYTFRKDHIQKNGSKEKIVTQQGKIWLAAPKRRSSPSEAKSLTQAAACRSDLHTPPLFPPWFSKWTWKPPIFWKGMRFSSKHTRWPSRREFYF